MRSVQFGVKVGVFLQRAGPPLHSSAALTTSRTGRLVTLLGQDMSPQSSPPPAAATVTAGVAGGCVDTAPRTALLLLLAQDVLRHGAPPSLQSPGVVGRVTGYHSGDLRQQTTSDTSRGK